LYTVCEHSQCLPLCMYVGGRAWLCSHCILSPCYTSVPYPLCSLSTLNIRHAWTPEVGLRSPPSSKDLRLACAAVLHIPHVPSCICPRDALVTGAGLLLPSALWWLSAHTADGQHAYSPQSRLVNRCLIVTCPPHQGPVASALPLRRPKLAPSQPPSPGPHQQVRG